MDINITNKCRSIMHPNQKPAATSNAYKPRYLKMSNSPNMTAPIVLEKTYSPKQMLRVFMHPNQNLQQLWMNTDKTQIFEHDQLPEYHYSNFIGPQQIIIARYKITINAISNRNKKKNLWNQSIETKGLWRIEHTGDEKRHGGDTAEGENGGQGEQFGRLVWRWLVMILYWRQQFVFVRVELAVEPLMIIRMALILRTHIGHKTSTRLGRPRKLSFVFGATAIRQWGRRGRRDGEAFMGAAKSGP